MLFKYPCLSFFAALAAALAITGNPCHGQQLYEGFDYPAGSDLSQNGGTGWGSAWTTNQITSGASVHSVAGALTFSGLEVTGNSTSRVVRAGQSSASRALSAESVAALTADDSTIWFSVLMSANAGDGQQFNTFGTLVFGSEQLDATGAGADNGANIGIAGSGDGFGVGFGGTNGGFDSAMVQGVSFENGNLTQSIADREVVGASTTLLVGKIDWAANGANDMMTVYRVNDIANPLGEILTTMAIDVDQTQFDTISICDGQTSAFDEIRLGATLEDVLVLGGGGGDPAISDGPNIIYILVDDMGYSDLGCYGSEIETPHIDSLAAEGLRFRQFYNCAKCETTRTSIMSGLYHGRGLNASGGATLAEALKTVGYRNYAVGKWHLGAGSNIPVQQGFDNFYGFYGGESRYFPTGIVANTIKRDAAENGNLVSSYPNSSFNTSSGSLSSQTAYPQDFYLTDGLGDNAVTFIQDSVTNHPERPFFLYLAFNAPHTPLQAPVALIDKYRNNGTYDAGWDQLRIEKWERLKAAGLVDPEWELPELRDDTPQWDALTAVQKEAEIHRRAVYAAMMDSVDQNVGKVLQQLAASGIADDTLVIFTGDNGAQAFDNTSRNTRSNINPSDPDSLWNMGSAWAALSNSPFRYYKQSQHQGGICTPLIARWPEKIAPGTMTDQPGHVVDMMATFVDIADADYDSLTKNDGQPVPPMDGASLLPIFEGGTRPAPDFWGFEHTQSEFGVIQGDWKLVSFSSSPWRLYNLKSDRTETRNLRWDDPDKVQELAALYDLWAIDTYGDTSRTYAERDTRNQLSQELRYARVLAGGLLSVPGVDISLSNIGSGQNASMNDHWEFYLTSTSASGLSGTSDSVTFANKPFVGNGRVIAQVESMSGMTAAGNAGVMIRESLAADSALIMIGVQANGTLVQSVRSDTGETVTTTTPGPSVSLPVFLKITREGDQFIPCYSSDELNWTSLPAVNLNLPAATLGGLSTASGNNSTRATVTFREWENRSAAANFLLGDANLDGAVDFLDISAFIALLSSSDFLDQADTNQDGMVNFLDISPFITILSAN